MEARLQLLPGCAKFLWGRGAGTGLNDREEEQEEGGWGQGRSVPDVMCGTGEGLLCVSARRQQGRLSVRRDRQAETSYSSQIDSFSSSLNMFILFYFIFWGGGRVDLRRTSCACVARPPLGGSSPLSQNPAALSVGMQPRLALIMS